MGNKSKSSAGNKTERQHLGEGDEARISKQKQSRGEESPSGLTHGFWLQQYSWLHSPDQQQQQQQRKSSDCGGRSTATAITTNRQEDRPQKLMARWRSGLLRTFAGLSASHENVQQHVVQSDSDTLRPTAKRRLWFASNSPSAAAAGSSNKPKSTSAGHSTLDLPPSAKAMGQSQSANSSHSSLLLLPPPTAHDIGDIGEEGRQTQSANLSPYRRLARVLKSPSKTKTQEPASCQKRGRLMRLAHSCSSSNPQPASVSPAAKVLVSCEDEASRHHSRSQNQEQQQQKQQPSGGLLSSILVSPLFRSKPKNQSGRAHLDKKQQQQRKKEKQQLNERGKKSSEIRGSGSIEEAPSKCCLLGIEQEPGSRSGRRRRCQDENSATAMDRLEPDAGFDFAQPTSSPSSSQPKDKTRSGGYLAGENANESPADEQQQPKSGGIHLQALSQNSNNTSGNNGCRQDLAADRLTAAESSLLPLITGATTTGGSSSSLASSSMICFDEFGQSNEPTPRHCNSQKQNNNNNNNDNSNDDDDDDNCDDYDERVQVVQVVGQTISSRDPIAPPSAPALEQPRAVSQPVAGRSANLDSSPDASREGGQVATPSGGGVGGTLKNNFKKLIKRQQSVDSYRMARDLKNKLRRQNEARNKHQSNEAIKTKSVGDEHSGAANEQQQQQQQHHHDYLEQQLHSRKYSMLADMSKANLSHSSMVSTSKQQNNNNNSNELREAAAALRISIDPYAKPGTFELPGGSERSDNEASAPSLKKKQDTKPTPPNTLSLSLMPGSQVSFSGSSFSGCITPTYPTHHLPSPKYVSPNKKYSNASTISSSFGGESLLATANCHSSASSFQGRGITVCSANQTTGSSQTSGTTAANQSTAIANNNDLVGSHERHQQQQSDTENTSASSSASPMRMVKQQQQLPHQDNRLMGQLDGSASSEQLAALAAARRADLAEHIYDNKCGLGEDMKFLASLPELCDITFLVGETREPVCAVKSVLAARSRVFNKILFGNRMRAINRQKQQQQQQHAQRNSDAELVVDSGGGTDRRSSSPRLGARNALTNNRSSSPVASHRSVSPKQPQHQQQLAPGPLQLWSVTTDASGYAQPAALELNHRQQQQQRRESMDRSGGRASIVSTAVSMMGRESAVSQLSQTSQGSQQPLIIGPGQTATPAPIQMTGSLSKRNKRSSSSAARDIVVSATGNGSGLGSSAVNSVQSSSSSAAVMSKQLSRQHSREAGASRLSRMFMKRSSDPSIKQQQQHQQQPQQSDGSNQNYLDKMSSSQMSTTMIIEEFEPDVFRQLIEYIHTGCVLLQARTLLGLLNAADYYGLEQLRKACLRFVSCCITVDTVCSLLSTAERYIQYKCTKSIVQKVLEFVDTHADEIFKLNAFGLLPEHVVRLILARDGLQADEHAKYNGVYTWCEHYCRSYELTNIADVMRNFLDFIQFHKIPTNILLSEIYPTHTVPDTIFLSALAYQADPKNLEPQPLKARRMTLPNPTFHKDNDSEPDDNDDRSAAASAQPAYSDHQQQQQQKQQQQESTIGPVTSRTGRPVAGPSFSSSWSRESKLRRKSNQQQQQQQQQAQRQASRDSIGSGQYSLVQQAAALRTTSVGRKSIGGQQQQSSNAAAKTSGQRTRKGSIAQVSIIGVKRLSHKLSIKRRAGRGDSVADRGNARRPSVLSKQQSLLSSSTGTHHSSMNADDLPDPLRVGQQILDAYLEQQRQRELEEAEQKRREADQRKADQAANNPAAPAAAATNQSAQQEQQTKQPIVKVSLSTRKSFKDFKHISRRIFMRHSSSNKMVQQQQQQQQQQRHQSPIGPGGPSAGSSCSSSSVNLGPSSSPSAGAAREHPQHQSPLHQQQQQLLQREQLQQQTSSTSKRRNLLKIKRSETVFETSSASPSSRLSHQLSANMLGK